MKISKILHLNLWHLDLLRFVCFFNFINGSTDLDYLKEQPSFLTPCKINDSNNSVCLAKALEIYFTQWIKDVNGWDSFDPFPIKRVHLRQNNENINIKIDMKDVILTGLSHGTVSKASVNDDYTFKFLASFPSLHFKGNYRMKGSLLLLKLNISGSMEFKASDLQTHCTLKSKLIEVDNQHFFDISSIQLHIKNIAYFHIDFTDNSNGSTELIKTLNDLLNQNWRDIFEIVRPVIQQTLETLGIDRFKKIFRYVPAKYFFVDLP